MTDLNSVSLIGRATHDVGEKDFGYAGELAKLKISLAVNRSKKSGDQWIDEASFFEVVIYGARAESLKNYISKGKQIAVEGYLKQDRWEKDGEKKSKIIIVANNIELLGGKEDAPAGKEEKPNFMPKNMEQYKKGSQQPIIEEDLPW